MGRDEDAYQRPPRSLALGAPQLAPSSETAAERPPEQRRLAALVSRYVTHADRTEDEENAFHAWTRQRSIGLVRLLAGVFIAIIVATWPGDLRFRGADRAIFDAFVIWRATAVVVLFPFMFAHRIPFMQRQPLRSALVAYVAFVAVLGYSLGRIGSLDSPWFYALYGCAWLTVVFPVRLLERCAFALATSVAGVAAYFIPHPAHFDHPHVDVPLINLASFTGVAIFIGHIVHHLVRDNYFAHREVDAERARSEQLLHNMLPGRIAARLKRTPGPIGHRFDSVTVLFADVVGFTKIAGQVEPERLIAFLNEMFTRFDAVAVRHGVEKIKTIGDGYVVAAGLPEPHPDHAAAIADTALDMLAVAAELRDPLGDPVQLRIGIQTGPAVAGVIGVAKLTYDLWGDTVNMASRLESHGAPGRIQVGDACYQLLATSFELEPRGTVELKGKGSVQTYWLLRRKEAST